MTSRFAIALLLAGACGGAATPAPAPAAPAPRYAEPAANADLREIDWKNRTYNIPGSGEDDLVAGTYEVTDGGTSWDRGDGDHGWFQVNEPSFGDVDGDGDDEAIVIVIANGGGSGAFSSGLIYRAVEGGGEPLLLDSVPGGDRGAGGLRSIEVVEPTVLRVVRNWLAPGDGANNWSLVRIERWRWKGGKLVEDEAARETRPAAE